MKNSIKRIIGLVAIVTTLTGVSSLSEVSTLADSTPSEVATGTATATPDEIKNVNVTYSTNVQRVGWQDEVADGALSGTEGKSLGLEGIKINVTGNDDLGIEYSTYVQKKGWQDYVSNGEPAGTEGLRLEAIKIKLTGEEKYKYDVFYRVHVQSYGWLDWASDDDVSGTVDCSKRIEAIEIKVVKKDVEAILDESKDNLTVMSVTRPTVSYKTYVQRQGWQYFVSDGAISGTTGKGLRMEAFTATSNVDNVNLIYSAHVQRQGWQYFVSDGTISGTTGKGLRMEAIKIKLEGSNSKYFDVYYRVHAQHFGWMGWTKNGEAAGTEGFGYRLEGIQIKIVAKGNPAPGSTSNAFRKAPKKAPANNGYTDGAIDKAYSSELYKAVCCNFNPDVDDDGGKTKLSNICRAVAEGKMSTKTAEAQANKISGICYNRKLKFYYDYQFCDAVCKVFRTKKVSGKQLYKMNGGPVLNYGSVWAYKHKDGTYTIATLGVQ